MDLLRNITTLDFESEAIGPRPDRYPPRPVGLAIRWPTSRVEYMAWGHPTGNNCTFDEARRAYIHALRGPVLFHNHAFDCEVATAHFDAPWPQDPHDTLFLLYLMDHHAKTYSLKPSAERLLGEPPNEQDAVRDWILANVDGATKKNFGAFISLAPVDLVGPYAIGDVTRTYALFRLLYPRVASACPEAYNRELRLTPHLLESERRGTRVDREKLEGWSRGLADGVAVADIRIQHRLCAPGLNVNSDEALADALDRAGVMVGWEYTDGTTSSAGAESTDPIDVSPFTSSDTVPSRPVKPKRRSVSRPALSRFCKDRDLLRLLEYRGLAGTMLNTFVLPWLTMSAPDGRLHTKWHQVRGDYKNGTRTGRIASSDPNLANIPNAKDVQPPEYCMRLPTLREALLPEEGHVWLSADYSQQELRWAAHFAEGDMLAAYRANPSTDLHEFAKVLVSERSGIQITRKQAKTIAFATIYGAGLAKLAQQLGCTVEDAGTVRSAYFKAIPGLRELSYAVQQKGKLVGFVRSAGGRLIRPESPGVVDGVLRTFDYKLLNHLIQGSAADQTKQAIIDFGWYADTHFLNSVYDELNISVLAEPSVLRDAGNRLATSMRDAVPCDAPVLTDFEVGRSWGTLIPITGGADPAAILAKVLT